MLRCEGKRELSDYTTLKIGGRVSSWLEPENLGDIQEAISIAERDKKDVAIIGKGSNILAQDKGFSGILINLSSSFNYIEREGSDALRVGASLSISRLVEECTRMGLGGCEFLSGIPGSLGGAIFMNAGVRDIEEENTLKEIKDIIIDVDALDLKEKKKKTLDRSSIDFSYRSSDLDGKCILGARIKLRQDKKVAIINRIDGFMKAREWIKKIKFPSAGCVFKNPKTEASAARLIEGCNLKGKRIGGAEVSRVHANFIVNTGGARSKDVLDLIELVKDSVREKFGVELELELKVLENHTKTRI